MRLFGKVIKVDEVSSFDNKQLARIIDVRSKQEFKAGHIKGSKNIPFDKLVSNPQAVITSDDEYYILCHSGIRSKRAISALKKQGYTNLTNLKGGYSRYERI